MRRARRRCTHMYEHRTNHRRCRVSSSPSNTTWPFYVSDAYGFASFYACQSASE